MNKKSSISNTKIKKRTSRKTNPDLSKTIADARKNVAWRPIANFLSGPTNAQAKINLKTIEGKTSAGDTVVIPGKVLASGELSKKVRIVALSISESALAKLKDSKSEFATIADEIKINAKAEGLKIIQ